MRQNAKKGNHNFMQIAQETELACAYKRIFEYKKNNLTHVDKQALGAVALSFELTADLIFI